jgi:uncharacterized protein (TIGR03000 family)
MAPPPKPDKPVALPNQARLIVELPANARLYIDDQLMQTPSGRRTFNSPVIEPGQAYYYMARAEVVIDGKTYTETKRAVVRAGQVTQVTFQELLAATRGVKPPPVQASAQ